MSSLLEELKLAASCPTGSAEDWKGHYAPDVASVTRHRETRAEKWSIVVVAWRSSKLVVDCLDRLIAQRGFDRTASEIVLVDNGGLDSVRRKLASRVDVEIIMKRNVGLCPARNLGVAYAQGPIVNFVDDDGLVLPDYAENALPYFDDPNVFGIHTKIVWKNHRYFTTLPPHYDRGPRAVEDFNATEGSSFVRRALYLKVGGFGLLSGHEGLELTRRMELGHPGGRFLYVPNAVMRHDYIDSWGKFWRKTVHYSSIDARARSIHPEVSRYLDEVSTRCFPERELSLEERVARAGLRRMRIALRKVARTVNHIKR